MLLKNDLVNLLTNMIGLLLVVLICYRGNAARKIIAFVASYGMGILTENIAWAVFVKDKGEEMFAFGFFFANVTLTLSEIIIEKTINICKGVELSIYNSLFLVLVSVGSIFIACVLIEGFYHKFALLVVALCILLAINIAVFYLCEKLLNDYVKQKNEEMYRLQLAMYQNQLQLMKSTNDAYSIARHDMKHHIILLEDYIEKGESDKALEYLGKISGYTEQRVQHVRTGNDGIDSIFNYFITEVNHIGGNIHTELKIPEGMAMDEFDINMVLSNLLMNAYEAIQRCNSKEIQASMRYDRGTLKIQVVNTYNGDMKKEIGKFFTTKQDAEGHGFGLISVRKVVEKYKGSMIIVTAGGEFKVDILLYI